MTKKRVFKIALVGLVVFLALPLIFDEEAANAPTARTQQQAEAGEEDYEGLEIIDINSPKKGRALPQQDANFLSKFTRKITNFYSGGFRGKNADNDKFVFADADINFAGGDSRQARSAVESGMLDDSTVGSGSLSSGGGYRVALPDDIATGRQMPHQDIAVQGLYDTSATASYEDRTKAKKAYSSVMRKIGAESAPSAPVAVASANTKRAVQAAAAKATASSTGTGSQAVGIASRAGGSSSGGSRAGGSSSGFAGGGVAAGSSDSGAGASLGNMDRITADMSAKVREAANTLVSNRNGNSGGSSSSGGSVSSGNNNSSNNSNPNRPGGNNPGQKPGGNKPGQPGQPGGNNPEPGVEDAAFNPEAWKGCHIEKEDPKQEPAKKTTPTIATGLLNPTNTINTEAPEQGCEEPPNRNSVKKVQDVTKEFQVVFDAGSFQAADGQKGRVVPHEFSAVSGLVLEYIDAPRLNFEKEEIKTQDFEGETEDSFVIISEDDLDNVASREDVLLITTSPAKAKQYNGLQVEPDIFASWQKVQEVLVPGLDGKAIEKKQQNEEQAIIDNQQKADETAEVKDLVKKK